MRRLGDKRHNSNTIQIAMVLFAIIFVTLMANITLAFIHFEMGEDFDIHLGIVTLDASIDATSSLEQVKVGDEIVETSSFTKALDAPACYVRARIEFYSPLDNLSEGQENYLLALNSLDFGSAMTTGIAGTKWLSTGDNNYYLVSTANNEMVLVNDNSTYNFVSDLVFPDVTFLQRAGLSIELIESLKLSIKFQGIQSQNLPSTQFNDLVRVFNDVFKPLYSREAFLVVYNTQGRVDIAPSIVNVGANVSKPADPVISGYNFEGWYIDSAYTTAFNFNTNVNRNYTLYGKFVESNPVITYMNYDLTSVYLTVEVAKNAVTTMPAAPTHTNPNAVFEGWYTDADFYNRFTFGNKLNNNVTLYPKFDIIYNVVFMVDGSTYNRQQILLNNYPTNPSNPTKSGYEFDGWTINGIDIVTPSSVAITANTTFTAVFTSSFTVTFVSNGSTFATQTVTTGYASAPGSPTKSGYTFAGWSVDGTTVVNLATYAITANTTFIAVFVEPVPDGVYYVSNADNCLSITVITITSGTLSSYTSGSGWRKYGPDISSVVMTGNIITITYSSIEPETITYNYYLEVFEGLISYCKHEANPIVQYDVSYSTVAPNGTYICSSTASGIALKTVTISNGSVTAHTIGSKWEMYEDVHTSVTMANNIITITYYDGGYRKIVFDGALGVFVGTISVNSGSAREEVDVTLGVTPTAGTYTCAVSPTTYVISTFKISSGALSSYTIGGGWNLYGDAGSETVTMNNHILTVTYDSNYLDYLTSDTLIYNAKIKIFVGMMTYCRHEADPIEPREVTYNLIPSSGSYYYSGSSSGISISYISVNNGSISGYSATTIWLQNDSAISSVSLSGNTFSIRHADNTYQYLYYNPKTRELTGTIYRNSGSGRVEEEVVFTYSKEK